MAKLGRFTQTGQTPCHGGGLAVKGREGASSPKVHFWEFDTVDLRSNQVYYDRYRKETLDLAE